MSVTYATRSQLRRDSFSLSVSRDHALITNLTPMEQSKPFLVQDIDKSGPLTSFAVGASIHDHDPFLREKDCGVPIFVVS